MGVLQRFERRLEGLVQGAFAKAFGGWVEPVEIAAALTREAEDRRAIVAAGRVLVPNAYVVELSPADTERLGEYDEPLRTELAAMVAEAAQEHGWSFVGPVEVAFEEVAELDTGAFRVRSSVLATEGAGDGAGEAVGDRARDGVGGGAEVTGPRVEVNGTVRPLAPRLVVGRGADTDVRLTDTGVSRQHAELVAQDGGVEVHDLGSTNGTWVNGKRVSTATLRDGDRVTVGTTELVVRTEG